MLAVDEDALFCDLAQTYHVIGFDTEPPEILATLAAGLGEESRIKQKMNRINYPPLPLLATHAVDELKILRYALTASIKAEKPYFFSEHMRIEEKAQGFSTPEEFLQNWNKNNERGE